MWENLAKRAQLIAKLRNVLQCASEENLKETTAFQWNEVLLNVLDASPSRVLYTQGLSCQNTWNRVANFTCMQSSHHQL